MAFPIKCLVLDKNLKKKIPIFLRFSEVPDKISVDKSLIGEKKCWIVNTMTKQKLSLYLSFLSIGLLNYYVLVTNLIEFPGDGATRYTDMQHDEAFK